MNGRDFIPGALRQCRFELGLILAVIGTQIAVITRLLLPIPFDLTKILFLLSLLLIADYGQFTFLKTRRISRYLAAVLGYNLYVLLAALLAEASLNAPNTGTVYTLYVAAFLCVLCFRRKREINGERFVSWMWGISGLYSLILFYLITEKFTRFTGNAFVWLYNGSFSADRLTLSVIAFVHMICFLAWRPKKKGMEIPRILLFLVAAYDMAVCSRRGLLLTFFIILVYRWMILRKSVKVRAALFRRVVMGAAVLGGGAVIAYLAVPAVRNQVQQYADRVIQGVSTYLGKGQDAAAANRAGNLSTVPREFLNSGLGTILFGNGYAHRHLDIPYLQAFTDLGLVGGTWYFIIAGIAPVWMMRKRTENRAELLIRYIAIMNIVYNVYSGVPYNHYKFIGLILLGYMEMGKGRKGLEYDQAAATNQRAAGCPV